MPEFRSEDDSAILRGCLKGERKYQKMLYDKYAPKMYSICLGYARDRSEAKDILQEGFIKVFRNLKDFKVESSLDSWIWKIITNTAIDHYRQKKRLGENIESNPGADYLQIPEKSMDQIGYDNIIDIINQLPDGARVVFNLHVLEGYTHKEIAKMLNITEGTSKSQLNRAKNLLKKMLPLEMNEIRSQ